MKQPYKPKMSSGLFRNKIWFQEYDESATSENGFPLPEEERYKDVVSAWAMIKTPNDRTSNAEFYEAATTYAKNTLTFVVRYVEGIHSDMRIKYKDRYFEIVSSPINDNELNKTLTIVAREVI